MSGPTETGRTGQEDEHEASAGQREGSDEVTPEPSHDDEPTGDGSEHIDDLHHDDGAEAHDLDHHEADERGGGSIAGRLLTLLLGLLVGGGVALWGAPKVAPHLPYGVAKYLQTGETVAPGSVEELRSAVGSLRDEAEAGLAGLEERIAANTATMSAATSGAQLAASEVGEQVTGRIDELTQMINGVSERVNGLTDEIDQITQQVEAAGAKQAATETGLSDLRSEIDAMAGALTDAQTGEVAAEDVAASLAQLRARVDEIAGTAAGGAALAALENRIETLSSDLDATREAAAQAERERQAEIAAAKAASAEALRQAEEVRKAAEAEAEAARVAAEEQVALAERNAAIVATSEQLRSRLEAGEGFEEALDALEAVSGTQAPGPLRANAEAGVPTIETLQLGFGDAARAAIAADVEAGTDAASTFGRLEGFVRSQVLIRETGNVGGDGVEAVLSRAETRLAAGDAPAALTELDALPEHAKSALGAWLSGLAGRVGAEDAFASYLAAIGING